MDLERYNVWLSFEVASCAFYSRVAKYGVTPVVFMVCPSLFLLS